ncbi:MAG TPA: ribosome maturation factor RimM [Gammaproteobacteria bacterium]|nr:ribosome maturation factor RimM [Gammaproteobacteria bacterium]
MSKMDADTDAGYVVIGKIGSTYGIHGWLKIFSFTEVMTDILDYAPWYLDLGENWQPIQVKEGRQHGKALVAHLAGYNTPEEARVLTGKKIAVKRSQLPSLPEGTWYWKDLEGLMVIDQHGKELGPVLYLLETGSNDVLVIRHEGKEHAIPWLPGQVVKDIDLANRIMRVEWDLI